MTVITFTHADAAIKAGWTPPNFKEYSTRYKPKQYAIPTVKSLVDTPHSLEFAIGNVQDVIGVLNVIHQTAR